MVIKRPAGFWVLMSVGGFLLVELCLGQMMALIDYDFTVAIGLQEAPEIITPMGVAFNLGFGLGDTLVFVPLLVLGLVGLWLRRAWGLVAMAGALGITAYFPIVCYSMLLFARKLPGVAFMRFVPYAIILAPVVAFACWGLAYISLRWRALLGDAA